MRLKHLMPGDRVNTMTLIKKMDIYNGRRQWLAKCDCGQESVQTNRNMVRKKYRCGYRCSLTEHDLRMKRLIDE